MQRQKANFLYFGINENAFDITENALIPQLLGDFARVTAGLAENNGSLPPVL